MRKEIYILIGLIAIFSFTLVSPVKAALLTEASTTPATPYISNVSRYSVSFKVASSTEIVAQIRLIFPAGFDISAAANQTSTISVSSTLAAALVASSTVSGQELTLWLIDGAVTAADDTIIISGIPNIVNPATLGPHILGIETRTSDNEPSEANGVASSTPLTLTGVSSKPKSTPYISYSEGVSPTSNITDPSSGLTISAGEKYTIKGTAQDQGGSTIQKIEVSLDDGKSWSTTEIKSTLADVFSWEYVWQNPTEGTYTIKSRATDTMGNIENPRAGVKVTVSAAVPVEKPITEMTVLELEAKITEIQQKIIDVLGQIIQLFQQQIQALLAK